MMKEYSNSGFLLGDQHIEPARCAIQTTEGEIRIEPRVMDVLMLLVTHAGQVVTREEFIKSVWGGTFVTDEVLSRCVYRIRQALGDNPKQPRFIETVPKRGYRLIAPVRKNVATAEEVTASAQDTLPDSAITQQMRSVTGGRGLAKRRRLYWIAPVAAVCALVIVYLVRHASTPQEAYTAIVHDNGENNLASVHPTAIQNRDSIAVLPFVNMSQDPEHDYVSDGLTEELIGLLAKVPHLKVVARTSTFMFKGKGEDVRRIAELLGVNNVLEGSVRIAGNHIRVATQLIDANTGYHIWAETLDLEFKDIFTVQEKIASAIVRALKVSLETGDAVQGITGREAPTADMIAYRFYLQGLYHWKRRGESSIRKSIDLFRAAIERDPTFAQPYQALATAYLVLPFYSRESSATAFEQAAAAANNALKLEPSLGKAHGVLAFISLKRWDWSTAERQFQLALATEPNDPTIHQWYSEFLSYVGYLDASTTEALRARELDPVSPVVNDRLGVTYLWSGEYELAAEQFQTATELGLSRDAYDQAYALLLLHDGQIDEAVSLYEKILGKLGLDTDWVRPVAEATKDPALIPRALEAVALARADSSLPDSIVLYAAVLLKQPDLAFEVAENALADKSLTVEFIFGPEAKILRRDPRFPRLLTALGLDKHWHEHGWPEICQLQLETVICN